MPLSRKVSAAILSLQKVEENATEAAAEICHFSWKYFGAKA
jgi:hypothetical protein